MDKKLEDSDKQLEDMVKNVDMTSPSDDDHNKDAELLKNRTAQSQQLPPVNPIASGSATGNPRNKTALGPGRSLMDWCNMKAFKDRSSVRSETNPITMSELAKHNRADNIWIALRGEVYDVSTYLDYHPGGIEELMKGAGKDATQLFEKIHPWVNYKSILERCIIGRLSDQRKLDFKPNAAEKLYNDLSRSVKFLCRQYREFIEMTFRLRDPFLAYRLRRISNVKLRLDVISREYTMTFVVNFTGEITWPPTWTTEEGRFTKHKVTFPKVKKRMVQDYISQEISCEKTSYEKVYRDYEVVSNTPMCPTVNQLVLRLKDCIEYIPEGWHVEAKMNVMGTDVTRMYTPVPHTLFYNKDCQHSTLECLCIMVKRYPNGALSPSITALKAGETLTLSNSMGTFFIKYYDIYSTIKYFIVAGTGITPILGLIRRIRLTSRKDMHLIWFNKNEDNIFYVNELSKCSSQLKVTHVLSEPSESWTGMRGTVSHEMLDKLVNGFSSCPCIFTCGPKEFMQKVSEYVQKHDTRETQFFLFNDGNDPVDESRWLTEKLNFDSS